MRVLLPLLLELLLGLLLLLPAGGWAAVQAVEGVEDAQVHVREAFGGLALCGRLLEMDGRRKMPSGAKVRPIRPAPNAPGQANATAGVQRWTGRRRRLLDGENVTADYLESFDALLFAKQLPPTMRAMVKASMEKAGGLREPFWYAPEPQRDGGRWDRFLRKMLRGDQPVSMLMLGGSMVVGYDCSQGSTRFKACAYPERFKRKMQALLGKGLRFDVENMAMGGCTTTSLLAGLPMHLRTREAGLADIIVADFSVNDALQPQSWVDGSKKRWEDTRDNVIAHASQWPAPVRDALLAAKQGDPDPVAVFASNEVLARYVLSEFPDTSLMLLEAQRIVADRTQPSVLAHSGVAKHYGFPFLSYHHIAATNPKSMWGLPPKGKPAQLHPPWHVHEMVATVLAHTWRLELEAVCRTELHKSTFSHNEASSSPSSSSVPQLDPQPAPWQPPPRPPPPPLPDPLTTDIDRRPFSVCREPLDFYDAQYIFSRLNASTTTTANTPRGQQQRIAGQSMLERIRIDPPGSWRLFEDRAGKPGWISDGPRGAKITFPVQFGQRPRLQVGWLRSYAGIGDAVLTIKGSTRNLPLLGRQKEHNSVTFSLSLDVSSPVYEFRPDRGMYGGILGFAVHAHKRTEVTLTHSGKEKVKLLHLVSC